MGVAGHKSTRGGLVRISFPLESDSWHGSASEGLWAQEVGGQRYRLRNTPFYAFGVSAEDVVFARDADGVLTFAGVSLHGGHSTYRIMTLETVSPERIQAYWEPLENLGCSYEGGLGRLWAVDVPSTADIYRVYDLLERGKADQVWEFEEGHCGHLIQHGT